MQRVRQSIRRSAQLKGHFAKFRAARLRSVTHRYAAADRCLGFWSVKAQAARFAAMAPHARKVFAK
jgi:hypothetical protein